MTDECCTKLRESLRIPLLRGIHLANTPVYDVCTEQIDFRVRMGLSSVLPGHGKNQNKKSSKKSEKHIIRSLPDRGHCAAQASELGVPQESEMETIGELMVRRHGTDGPIVVVIHGGPGAAGSAVELALGLSESFAVVEPWQRGSHGLEPLTVAKHIADLHDLVVSIGDGAPPALVGESWGAMLALAYAAEYPHEAGPIVLVGCGTFNKESRAVGVKIREKRIAEYIADHPEHAADLDLNLPDRIMKWHGMTDTYAAVNVAASVAAGPFDAKAYKESWEDMIRCQEMGLYPGAFSKILSPVIMMHGSYDPHPGRLIRDSLKPVLPQLEYHEFERCGHQPAIEKYAKEEFFAVMHGWLMEKCNQGQ